MCVCVRAKISRRAPPLAPMGSNGRRWRVHKLPSLSVNSINKTLAQQYQIGPTERPLDWLRVGVFVWLVSLAPVGRASADLITEV